MTVPKGKVRETVTEFPRGFGRRCTFMGAQQGEWDFSQGTGNPKLLECPGMRTKEMNWPSPGGHSASLPVLHFLLGSTKS